MKKPNMSATAFGQWQTCPRAWWFRRVADIRPPKTASLAIGSAVHNVLEHYLLNGAFPEAAPEEILRIARPGVEALDAYRAHPGEWGVETDLRVKAGGWMGPLPFMGKVDVWTDEPAIDDHKTSKNLDADYHPTPETIGRNPQMMMYAGVMFHDNPVPSVRFGHLRYSTSGVPGFRRIIAKEPTSWGQIEDFMGVVVETAETMHQHLLVADPDEVEYKRSGCGAFGGCPYIAQCSVHKVPFAGTGGIGMGLLDKIKAARNDSPAETPQAIAPPDVPPSAAFDPKAIHKASMAALDAVGNEADDGDLIAWFVSPDGREALGDLGLTSADVPKIMDAIAETPQEARQAAEEAAKAQAATPKSSEAPKARTSGQTAVLEYIREHGPVRVEDEGLKALIKADLGLSRLQDKRKFAYLGDLADQGAPITITATDVRWDAVVEAAAEQRANLAEVTATAVETMAPHVEEARAHTTIAPDTGAPMVLVGCTEIGANVPTVDQWLAEAIEAVEKGRNEQAVVVPHWRMVPFGNGAGAVYAAAVALGIQPLPIVYIDACHPLVPFIDRLIPNARRIVGVK